MDEKKEKKDDWSVWLSTYGLLTAGRILESFHIYLLQAELAEAIRDPNNVYFKLLRVPLKNVFNGIILQQARDYQIYVQKLFVDYLLSGEDGKDESSPGAIVREDLELQRTSLIQMAEAFREQEALHQVLIAESQATLIALSQDLKRIEKDSVAFEAELEPYVERAETLNINLRNYRSQFYNLILRVTELLLLLPDYKIDETKANENREALQFDALIGE